MSVQEGADAFFIDRLVYRLQGSLVGGEAVIPYIGGASLIDDFQQPVDLLLQPVDINLQGVPVTGDGLAQGTLNEFGFGAHKCVSAVEGRAAPDSVTRQAS